MADTTTRDFPTVLRWLRGLRRPEYTGENRCYACTLVNLVFAEAVAITVGVWSIPAGIVVFAAAAAVIYLRGYLVPGTPELTRRYLPEPVLRLFGKDGSQVYGVVVDRPTADRPVVSPTLFESGIVTDTNTDGGESGPATKLSPAVEAAVSEEYDRIENEPDSDLKTRLASALGVDPASIAAVSGLPVYRIDGDLVRWESRTALHVDLALAPTFADRFDDWADREVSDQARLLAAGRASLGDCPACGSAPESSILTTNSCCRDPEPVLSIACGGCDVRLLERDADEIEAATGRISLAEDVPR